MKSKKIQIGVIGLGRIGWSYHCKNIMKHKHFNLLAVADPVEERLLEAKNDFHCQTFKDYKKLLDCPDLEAVVIASPTHLHKIMALEAIKRGIHLIMEKPIAGNLKDAKEIIQKAKRKKVFLTTYQPHRLEAYFQHFSKILSSGIIGEVYHIKFGRYRFVRRNDWQSLLKYDGGQLSNTGAHVLDQVISLLGPDIKDCFCQLRLVAALGDADDVLKILATNKKGLLAEVDINMATLNDDYLMEAIGTEGTVKMPNNKIIEIKKLNKKSLKPIKLVSAMASEDRKYPKDEYKTTQKNIQVKSSYSVNFYDDIYQCLRKGKEPFIKPEQTLAVMSLMERCKLESKKIIHSKL
ncbi:MAG: hypothetical protein COA79_09880 [Planctomycetota bacterium]|nr:MAG: hypothetical protein COA79_09880 [Planctomycetota bacterium]